MEYLAAKAGLRIRNTLHDVNVKAFMREMTKRAAERRENFLFLSLPFNFQSLPSQLLRKA